MNEKIEKKPVFLSPFKRFCMTIGELPTSYLETMTYYEMLLWFTKYLGETVIPTINNNAEAVDEMQKLFVELQNYVNDYFDNLDVQEEINNKLDEMAESGELLEIITQYLQLSSVLAYNDLNELKNAENIVSGSICRTLGIENYYDGNGSYYLIREKLPDDVIDEDSIISLTTSENLVGERIINNLSNNANQQMNELPLKRIIRKFERDSFHPDHVSGEDYAILQGGTYIENDKMIICNIRNNDINDTRVQEISITNGTVLREVKLPLSHANSVTYNPTTKKLYVTSLILNISNTPTPLQYLYVVDYDTLTLEETVTLNIPSYEGVHSVSYDIITNKYYVATEDTTANNKINLYEMNISDYSLTRINLVDYSGLLSTTNNNDIMVYNNILYVLKFSPQVILTYNLSNNKLENIYNIKQITNLGNYVGELQNISIKYDTELKNIVLGTNMIECENGFYYKFQIFETNTKHGINDNILPENYSNKRVVRVNINSNALNPNGDAGNEFKHLSEALEVASISNHGLEVLILDGTYPYVTFKNSNASIEIYGNVNTPANVIIQGLNLSECNYLYMTGLKIDNKSSSQNYDLYIFHSNLKIASIIMNTELNCHIFLRNSNLTITNINHTNYLAYCQTESSIITNDSNPTYKILNQLPLFNKPIKIINNVSVTSTGTTLSYQGYELMVEGLNKQLSLIGTDNYIAFNSKFFSRDNNGSRLITLASNDIISTISIDYDVSNKTLRLYLFKAFKISVNGITDITSTHSVSCSLYYNQILNQPW